MRPRREAARIAAGPLTALLALGLWSACQGPQVSEGAAPTPTTGAVADTLTALAGRFSPAYMRQDFDAIAAAYTPDAVVVWERGEDGRWRMAIDMWSPAPDPEP